MKTSWAFLEGSIVKFLNENLDPGLVSPALHGRWWLSGNILAYSYYKFPDGKSMATVGTSKTKNSSSYLVLTKTYFTLALETLYIYIHTYIIYMYTSCGNTRLHPLTEPEILINYNRNNDKPYIWKVLSHRGSDSSPVFLPADLASPRVLSIVLSLSPFTAFLGKLIHTCGFNHHLGGDDAQISIFSLVLTMEVQMDTCTKQTPGTIFSNWYSTYVNWCSFPRLLSVQIL